MKAALARAFSTVQRRFRKRHRYASRPPPTALRLIGGLAGLIVLGTVLLALPGMSTDGRLSINEALFTATSALSVTGLSVIVPSQDLTLAGQIVLLFLIQIGGVGFMVGAVVIFWLLGRKVSLIDRLALKDSLGLIAPGAIVKLTRRVIVTVFLIESIGALLLWLNWREQLGDEQALFYAIFHAVSAFCNAGFDLFNGLEAFPAGIPNDDVSLSVMAALIFLGGLGIPVLTDLLTWYRERRISLHTRITLVVIVLLICAGGLGMFLAERSAGNVLHDEPWTRQLLLGFFQSISARTAGFAGIQPFGEISAASVLLLLALMFIGAAPASMGGGITTGTFAVLGLTLWGYARGQARAHVGGRSLPPQMIQKAAAVLTISLFVVMFATWVLLMTHDVSLNVALFEVISAFATCGLSLGLTDELNLLGQFVIILMMFWGRLGALTIIVALAAQSRTSPLVSYPEENILIG